MTKVVLVADSPRGNGLKALSQELSKRLGYKVFCVTPNRVRRRKPVLFLSGRNKLDQFQRYKTASVSSPDFCTRLDQVPTLDTKKVVVRSLLNASEGRGITIVNKEECTQQAPLYTAYIPKKKEFRVHVWNNEVIDVQEKRRKRGLEQKEFQVRNTANGYVFCREGVVEPDDLRPLALAAVSALERSYGAVDIIWNEKQNRCFVLETNSRPGLMGTTVQKYADAIMKGLE